MLFLAYINLTMFQWIILLVKCLLLLHSKPLEDAKENLFHSYGDTLLVDSCALPLAVCLENCTSLLPGCILSTRVYGLNRKLTSNTTHFDNIFVFLTL